MREPGQIKRSPRIDTKFNAQLTDSDGNGLTVMVTDISREGCRMEMSEEGSLRIGEKVLIEVGRHGTYPAQIRWALGQEAGAVFLEPVFLPDDDPPAS
jgi:hypothetical protein